MLELIELRRYNGEAVVYDIVSGRGRREGERKIL